jgi:hypothetical protein
MNFKRFFQETVLFIEIQYIIFQKTIEYKNVNMNVVLIRLTLCCYSLANYIAVTPSLPFEHPLNSSYFDYINRIFLLRTKRIKHKKSLKYII